MENGRQEGKQMQISSGQVHERVNYLGLMW